MGIAVTVDLGQLAEAVRLPLRQVESAVHLLDAGNTVPFITRYRKDQTGGLDEEAIRQIQSRLAQTRMLADRKQTIMRSIESQGKLTDDLAGKILAAETTKRLEDLYLPFKPRKRTLATAARERGLEPLAQEILDAAPSALNLDSRAALFVSVDRGVSSGADAILGAGHILAEWASERSDLRERLRQVLAKTGQLTSSQVEVGRKQAKLAHQFRDYFNFREPIDTIPPHRVLAVNRGETAGVLRVRLVGDTAALEQSTDEVLDPPDHPHAELLRAVGRDALSRLVMPSLEREIRRELTDRAEAHALQVFARNLRHLLLQPPVRGRRVLAIDPGLRSGCKLAAMDEFGTLLEHGVIHLVGGDEQSAAGRARLVEMIRQHQSNVVAIGNGTGCRQAEELVASLIAGELAGLDLSFVIVNEAGASVYSTSRAGREELPQHDATLRGTISIGRRLQDPLSELVKIDPASIGVGLYQHDMKAKHLRALLDDVVESCVNYVGVELNSASPALLRYVSGLNQLTARRVYDYRIEHGPFKSREEIKKVPGLGDAAYTQAAGFLKISDSANALDATWIHPESYAVALRVLEVLGATVDDLRNRETVAQWAQRVSLLERQSLAAQLQVGDLTLSDILADLLRPGRDPREDLPAPVFRQGVLRLGDLVVGMELTGTVLNVVDFGAFVDIGLSESGLVHISQISNRYVQNPQDVVCVGDVVKTWVLSVDKNRRRVSLTMVDPSTTKRPVRSERDEPAPRPPADPGAHRKDRKERKAHEGRRPARRDARPAAKRGRRDAQPPRKPRPEPILVPLTDKMKLGKEPLRTFGDLKQFFDLNRAAPPVGEAPEPQQPVE